MRLSGLFVVIVVLLFVLSGAFFVVDEMHSAIVLQFGKHIKTISEAGLHFKIPFIQNVIYFDRRILEWDGEPTRIPTRDKKFIWIDATARWRITDPLLFYNSVRDEFGAQKKLDDIIDGIVRDIISNQPLIEIVRNTNRTLVYSEEFEAQKQEEEDILKEIVDIKTGRNKITELIHKRARQDAKSLGIEVIDVLIKRVNYTQEVRQKVYARMISERKKVAERYRAEGEGERARILGRMEKEIRSIRSESYRQAEEIKGKADAEAIRIYAEAYSKDPRFYEFLKTLENYKKSIDSKSTLILSTQNDFLKYLQSQSGSKK